MTDICKATDSFVGAIKETEIYKRYIFEKEKRVKKKKRN